MASKNSVTLTFAGDSKSIEKTFDRVGQGAKDLANDFDKASADAKTFGQRVDGAGSAVGDTESKFMGTADVLDGLATTMGFNIDRQIELARGFGDIAGGIENLKGTISGGIDKVGDMAKALKAGGKEAVLAKVQTVKSLAAQSVAWVKTSAQAMASAIRVRAAWLISMGPIALVVAAVAGAVFLIVKYWDEIKDAAEVTWNWVKDKFNALKDFFIQWAPLLAGPIGIVIKYWDEFKGAATSVYDWVTGKFNELVGFLTKIPGRIGTELTGAYNGFKEGATTAKNWVTDRFDDVVTFAKNIPERISNAVSGAFAKLKELATEAKNWVSDRFDDVVTFAKGVPGRITGVLSGAFNGIVEGFRSAWNAVANKINSVADFKIGLPGPIPDIHVNFPNLPTFHTGGIVPGTPGSQQMIMALGGERISSPGQSTNNNSVTINVYSADPRSAGKFVMDAFRQYEKDNGQVFVRV